MKKIYLTEEERKYIALTSPNECWICNELFESIDYDQNGYFILEKDLIDAGFLEHLEQIIRRSIVLEN